jgi:hypothetical protein
MPEIAWRKFFRMAKEAGISIGLPNSGDRADFRRSIEMNYGLNPRENPIRVVYIDGKNRNYCYDFFGDEEYFDSIKSEVMEMASKASEGRERIGFNNFHHRITPSEIVSSKLIDAQGTIDIIDPHMYDKLLVLFWRKVE